MIGDMLGMPEEDFETLLRWSEDMLLATSTTASEEVVARAQQSAGEYFTYAAQAIEARRKEPTDDLVSVLVNSVVDGDRLIVTPRINPNQVLVATKEPGTSIFDVFRAEGLQPAPDGRLVAVGSRDGQRAEAFADQYAAPNRHASYEALVSDPDIDAIYVATPHPFHKDASILCLEAGKAVLCENPSPSTPRKPRPSSPSRAPRASS